MELLIYESWDEVSLVEYEKICLLPEDDDKIISILSIFTGLSVKELNEIPSDYYDQIYDSMSWLSEEPKSKVLDTINIKGIKYGINKEFSNLSFGEVISIEQLLMNPADSYAKVCSVLLRKKVKDGLEDFNASIVMSFIEVIKDEVSIIEALGLVSGFFQWRSHLYNTTYSGLFSSGESEESEGPSMGPRFSPNWRWFSLMEKLAQGDITKFDEVSNQNYISCLNLLGYWNDKDKYLRQVEKSRK